MSGKKSDQVTVLSTVNQDCFALCCIQSKQRQVKTLTLQINMNKQESTVVPGNSLLVSSSS